MEDLKSIIKAKTPGEMIERTPCGFFEKAAVVFLFLFLISPLVVFLENTFTIDYTGMIIYTYNTQIAILGSALLILRILKAKSDNVKIFTKSYLYERREIILFLGMILLGVVSTALAGFTGIAVFGNSYRHEGIVTFYSYVLYFWLGTTVKKDKYRRVLIYSMVTVGFIIGFLAILRYYGVNIYPFDNFNGGDRVSAVFHQFNHYGYYLAVIITVLFGLSVSSKKLSTTVIFIIAAALNVFMLILNNCFGAYLAVFAGAFFIPTVYSLSKRKVYLKAFIPLLLFIAVSGGSMFVSPNVAKNISGFTGDVALVAENSENSETAGTGRWVLWTTTVELISEKPFFGYGADGIDAQLEATSSHVGRTHNEYLQYAAFFGIPAALSYISAVFCVFLKGLKNRHRLGRFTLVCLSGAFVYLFSAFFGNTMYYTAPYLFILLGLGLENSGEARNNEE